MGSRKKLKNETIRQFRNGNAPGPRINPRQGLPEIRKSPIRKGAAVRVEAAADELARMPKDGIIGASR